MRPFFVREHGAWVLYVTAFLLGILLARDWSPQTTPLAFVTGLALLHTEQGLARLRNHSINIATIFWTLFYAFSAILCVFFLYITVPAIADIGWALALFTILQIPILCIGMRKTLLGEFIGFSFLSLACPLAYVSATENLPLTLWSNTAVVALYFMSSVLSVQAHRNNPPPLWAYVAFHTVALCVVLTLIMISLVSMSAAFVLAMLTLKALVMHMGLTANLKIFQIGLLETVTNIGAVALLGIV